MKTHGSRQPSKVGASIFILRHLKGQPITMTCHHSDSTFTVISIGVQVEYKIVMMTLGILGTRMTELQYKDSENQSVKIHGSRQPSKVGASIFILASHPGP
jgi:hypothetical protein